jgi:hypothetical protein
MFFLIYLVSEKSAHVVCPHADSTLAFDVSWLELRSTEAIHSLAGLDPVCSTSASPAKTYGNSIN